METAFIGLDYIFDIACDGGKMATSAECVTNNNVISKANAAIEFARNNGWIVIQAKLGFSPSYIECPEGSPMLSGARGLDALGLYDFGTNFHNDLDVREGDIIIVKHRISVFYCTTLEAVLRANKVVRLVIFAKNSIDKYRTNENATRAKKSRKCA